MLVLAGYNRILTMDLHADQIQGFFPGDVPLDHLNAGPIFAEYFNELDIDNVVVMSADVGNLKKTDKYRRGFNQEVGIAVIDKRRGNDGEVISQQIIGDDVKGKTIFMPDDIISTAKTMRGAVEMAASNKRLDHPNIKEICVTDTIPLLEETSHLPIVVKSCAPMFAEAIYCIHHYQSISKLLGDYS